MTLTSSVLQRGNQGLKRRAMLKLLILAAVILFIALGLVTQQEWIGYFKTGDWASLAEEMGNQRGTILVITFVFMLMQNIFSLTPFLLLTMFNIWLFGFSYGYLWSLTGNFLGSVLVFYLARYGFQNWAEKYNHLEFKRKVEKNGFKVVLFLRLFPFMPASIVNIGSGLSKISARDYIFATFIGNTVFVFILSLFSAGVIALQHQYTLYIFISLFLLAVFIVNIKKRKSNLQGREEKK